MEEKDPVGRRKRLVSSFTLLIPHTQLIPGFFESFLDDLERVTSLRYMPTDDDVLKARLKTVGVSEYKFEMEFSAGRESGTEWRIIDVGGSRSQRRLYPLIICAYPLNLGSNSDMGAFF
jgi:hypothetical protein